MKRLVGSLLAMLLPCVAADAQTYPSSPHSQTFTIQLRNGEPMTPSSDYGFFLFRFPGAAKGHFPDLAFMRLLEPEELDQFDATRRTAFEAEKPKLIAARAKVIASNAALANGEKPRPVPPEPTIENYVFRYTGLRNIYLFLGKAAYAVTDTDHIYVGRMPPGTYTIIGPSWGMGNLAGCVCMGSVKFEIKAGSVVDLGEILIGDASEPSPYAELAGYTGLQISHRSEPPAFAMTVRPYTAGMPLPGGLSTIPADYRAQGKIPNFFYSLITRMAPVKGVLDYRLDKVMDVKSGQEAP